VVTQTQRAFPADSPLHLAGENPLLHPRSVPLTEAPGTIGVVTGELARYAAFWRSVSGLRAPRGSAVAQAAGLDLPTNRNRLAEATTGEWLFTLDDDVVVLPTTLERLLATMERGDWDVVAAFSLQRSPPFPSLVFLEDPTVEPRCPLWVPDGRTGAVEIAACGLGGVLIRTRVFAALERPYFRVGQVDPDHYHEDVEFCRRVRAAGFRIAVDLDCPIGHLTPMALWPGRDQENHPCAALVGGDGGMVPVDTAALGRAMTVNPALIGL
jgi:hypothetical protein